MNLIDLLMMTDDSTQLDSTFAEKIYSGIAHNLFFKLFVSICVLDLFGAKSRLMLGVICCDLNRTWRICKQKLQGDQFNYCFGSSINHLPMVGMGHPFLSSDDGMLGSLDEQGLCINQLSTKMLGRSFLEKTSINITTSHILIEWWRQAAQFIVGAAKEAPSSPSSSPSSTQ